MGVVVVGIGLGKMLGPASGRTGEGQNVGEVLAFLLILSLFGMGYAVFALYAVLPAGWLYQLVLRRVAKTLIKPRKNCACCRTD